MEMKRPNNGSVQNNGPNGDAEEMSYSQHPAPRDVTPERAAERDEPRH
jgi:hypothetical protein